MTSLPPRTHIEVAVEEPFDAEVNEDWVREWVVRSLDAEGVERNAGVDVLITDNDTVRELNRDYLGIDEPTAGLSFPQAEEYGGALPDAPAFITPPDDILHLGEIIIAYPYAVQQAAEQQHPVDWEIAHLLVHGVLHLLGYDHLEPEDEFEMRTREHAILGVHH
ncbi:MAG: rRNA maturation RNase YbeY [Chloroflexi bacterium]|nr:rRNA maturation RNase YbeY [Chloroflexota bacterium]